MWMGGGEEREKEKSVLVGFNETKPIAGRNG